MPVVGEVLNNRYKILRVLNKGGMGVVYQAADLNLKNTVVIKHSRITEDFLHEGMPNLTPERLRLKAKEFRKAFEREARLLRGLRHHALPSVIDYFTTDGGNQFFVMDFIPGKDLGELLDERLKVNHGPFPVDAVLDWGDQLLVALHFLHTHEPPIIHRDIKPQNLKLMPNGQIVLLDFGLAKGSTLEMSVVSRSLHGFTLQYAPLEQIRGKGTDERSDLYSVAVTLHHLLTGELPPSAVDRLTARSDNEPDPLRPLHEINPQFPLAISRILHQAASLNPNQRFTTAAQMRELIRQASQLTDNANNILTLADDPKLLPTENIYHLDAVPNQATIIDAFTLPIPPKLTRVERLILWIKNRRLDLKSFTFTPSRVISLTLLIITTVILLWPIISKKTQEPLSSASGTSPKPSVAAQLKSEESATRQESVTNFDFDSFGKTRIQYYITYFKTSGQQILQDGLRRSGRFVAMSRRIFEEEGVPPDLIWVAQIVSQWSPITNSGSGLWGLSPDIGAKYGLIQDYWIDERKGYDKSTRAAAQYLKDLLGRYKQNQELALAAYLHRSPSMDTVLERNEKVSFWEMCQQTLIEKGTCDDVAKILAIIEIVKDPQHYGFHPKPEPLLKYDYVTVNNATDLRLVADATDAVYDYVLALNTELIRGVTPPATEYPIRVPPGKGEQLANFIKRIPAEKRTSWRLLTIKPGDTLAIIAARTGVSKANIILVNESDSLIPGQKLIIPFGDTK